MKNRILIVLLVMFASFHVKSQELPTIGEVFDFSIGDEYHYISSYGWWGTTYIVNKIQHVNYSIDSSEVIYTVNSFSYYGWTLDSSANFEEDTLYIQYTNLDSSLFYYDELFEYDTINYFSNSLCGTQVYGAHYSSSGPWLDVSEREYAIGLGLIGSYYASDTGTSGGGLVYYIKNGLNCGSPIDISVGVDAYMELNSVSVYPTVFSDHVTIELDRNDNLSMQIFSMTGQELLTKELTSTSQQLDLSCTSPGTYIYIIRNDDHQTLKTGKIIKE